MVSSLPEIQREKWKIVIKIYIGRDFPWHCFISLNNGNSNPLNSRGTVKEFIGYQHNRKTHSH